MDITNSDPFGNMTNREIFIALGRGLHQFYDHGGISFGRGFQSDLLDTFRLRISMGNQTSFTSLTADFFDDGVVLGRTIRERRVEKRKKLKGAGNITELPEMSLAYLALDELIHYYESGRARKEGWNGMTPLNYAKAMRGMLELDFDFSGIRKTWAAEEIIAEGNRRNGGQC